jgi:hypothetical protein
MCEEVNPIAIVTKLVSSIFFFSCDMSSLVTRSTKLHHAEGVGSDVSLDLSRFKAT